MDYSIDADVPMPKKGVVKYPFSDMRVGESVYFEGMDTNSKPAVAARRYNSRGKLFECRKVSGGLRIWRVE